MIGKPLRRLEDHRLITGQGRFVDDINMDGMWHVVFVRSIEAHALIKSISLDDRYQGPASLITGSDLGLDRPMPIQHPSPSISQPISPPPLASDEACYVGQPLAAVVAPTVPQAVDAAQHVLVEYEPLPAIIDHRQALDVDAPMAHRDTTTNLIGTLTAGFGDIETVFSTAPHTLTIDVDQHRGALASMEGRGVVARWDDADRQLTLWTSSQSPHAVKANVASYLGMSPDELRVVAPDVGGGFGPKAAVYPEEHAMAALCMRLRRPLKWTELRREHFIASMQARGQSGKVSVAFDEDGTLLGLKAELIHDCGAYVPYGLVMVATTVRLMSGPYAIAALSTRVDCVFTNATPTGAIRGAGRPNAIFAVERAIDAVARRLGMGREDVRRRNLIRPERLPYSIGITGSDGRNVTYDSGDYLDALETALKAAAIDEFERRRANSAQRGRLRGYGIASYVEDTGVGPYDGARMEILTNGEIVIDVGPGSQGQGHATVMAQIASEHLGVDPRWVRVHAGDTARYGQGLGTVASRTGQTTAAAVHVTSADLAAMVKELAARRLEASVEDIVLVDGAAMVVGQPGTEIPLGSLAADLQPKFGGSVPEGRQSPGLSMERIYPYGGSAFTSGTHVAEVEVDPESGHIDVVQYVVVHDCGTLLNPMIVDGQIDGGVVHGLGNALTEEIRYWESGQPMSTSFLDYRLMTALDVPNLIKIHRESPSPTNPLGVKGAGEGGTIPAAAVVASAVEHALDRHGVIVNHYPIKAEWVYRAIRGGS